MLELQPGERLWQLFCFRGENQPGGLRHRIYTKQKANGRLALITFAVHNPLQEDGTPGTAVRSALARVPDLTLADLDRLIQAVRGRTPEERCESLDLSQYTSLNDQIARLEQLAAAEGGRDVPEPGGD